jgi:hypothetical protein
MAARGAGFFVPVSALVLLRRSKPLANGFRNSAGEPSKSGHLQALDAKSEPKTFCVGDRLLASAARRERPAIAWTTTLAVRERSRRRRSRVQRS